MNVLTPGFKPLNSQQQQTGIICIIQFIHYTHYNYTIITLCLPVFQIHLHLQIQLHVLMNEGFVDNYKKSTTEREINV